MMKSLRGREFDEMDGKSEATKKPNSYRDRFPGLCIFYDKGFSGSADPAEEMSMFDGFITNSELTKQTLCRKFSLDPDRVKEDFSLDGYTDSLHGIVSSFLDGE